jgi:hypothetical protein
VRRSALIATAIFALTLATRVPFASSQLWAWDSVLYARALEDGFHVDYVTESQRPHPPGYILYVGIASVARQFTNDSNSALVLVSMIASALAAAARVQVARRLAADRAPSARWCGTTARSRTHTPCSDCSRSCWPRASRVRAGVPG